MVETKGRIYGSKRKTIMLKFVGREVQGMMLDRLRVLELDADISCAREKASGLR